MWRFKVLPIVLAMLTLSCSASIAPSIEADIYTIAYPDDAQSERWGEYLFAHLRKRANDKGCVVLAQGATSPNTSTTTKQIYLEVAPNLKQDYCIEHTTHQLAIKVRNSQTALWIVYQLIDCIADADNRFDTSDLPPAVINFDSKCVNFDFEYREPYFAPNLKPDYAPIMGNNNVDTDWGLWGHNLSKVLDGSENESIYALVDGKRNKAQFSFASPQLLASISRYITDNYGDGAKLPYRFMIMPQDNDMVCTCQSCTAVGNTPTNATPAVTYLMGKLAERFPKHFFFTTAYRTTTTPPAQMLPSNAGVFFSTIDLPTGIALTTQNKATNVFVKQLDAWKSKTSAIYLWHYAANFDDYLTPIPILLGLQQQLQFFKQQSVKGIFINASGYDYSPFDDVKTFVAAALMMDADSDVEMLCQHFLEKEYPVSHTLLFDYYMSLEKTYALRNKAYNMYGSMVDNGNTYFETEPFIAFYNALEAIISKARDEEKTNLQKLFTALSFTCLQVAYTRGVDKWGYAQQQGNRVIVNSDVDNVLAALANYAAYPDMQSYKETDGSLVDYIDQWQQLKDRGSLVNLLINEQIELLSHTDEGFEKANLLHDGTLGFATDYHQGWYLSSVDDLRIAFATNNLQQAKKICMRFLYHEGHRILPPEKIEIMLDGKLAKTISSNEMKPNGNIVECMIDISFAKSKNVELNCIRQQGIKSTIACDEIRVF